MSQPWSVLAAEVQTAWVAAQADAEAGRQGRNTLVQALQALVSALEGASGSGWRQVPADHSVVASFRSLQAMAADPHMPLPLALSQALQMTHRQLSELQLRQAQSQEDPQWLASVVGEAPVAQVPAPPMEAEPFQELLPPVPAAPPAQPTPAASGPIFRDWWSIPEAGLKATNQWFLSEARDLLRGADLALVALATQPQDSAEQQVVLRALQAVGVSAQSMGLHRVAAVASDGCAVVEPWIDTEEVLPVAAWKELDYCLSDLYAELMDLVGEPIPGRSTVQGVPSNAPEHPPEPQAEPAPAQESIGASVQEPVSGPPPVALPPSPSAFAAVPMAASAAEVDDSWGLFEPLDPPETTDSESPPPSEPETDTAPAPVPVLEPEPSPEPEPKRPPVEPSIDDSWGLFDPLPPVPVLPAPWWTAIAWSVWARKEGSPPTPPGNATTSVAEAPSLDAEGLAPMGAATPGLRVAPAVLQQWSDTLSAWARARPDDRQAMVVPESIAALLTAIDAHRASPVDSAAVALHRAVRRAERALGQRVAFEWSSEGATLDAVLLSQVLPVWEALVAQWVGDGATDLALIVSERPHGLCCAVLQDRSGVATQGRDWHAAVVHLLNSHPSVLPLGAAWHLGSDSFTLQAPAQPHAIPVQAVRAGRSIAYLPLAWIRSVEPAGEAALRSALRAGQWPVDGGSTSIPLLRAGALLRPDRLPLQDSFVLRLDVGTQALALQVDQCEAVLQTRPCGWPASLEGLRQRAGAWSVATDASGKPLVVLDPFALAARYGAAARVLSRPSA